jgi:hypothetical protein
MSAKEHVNARGTGINHQQPCVVEIVPGHSISMFDGGVDGSSLESL